MLHNRGIFRGGLFRQFCGVVCQRHGIPESKGLIHTICNRHLKAMCSNDHHRFPKGHISKWTYNTSHRKLLSSDDCFRIIPATYITALTASHRKSLFKQNSIKCKAVDQNIDLSRYQRHFSTKHILDASPPKFQPYLRLIRFDKPIGTYLLFWPCTWSIGLAAQAGHLPDFYLLALFGVGSFIMRGAGCIINDMWDRDIDAKVERTKTRPLASGELNMLQAMSFLGLNLSLALGILLQLNWYSVFVGACSMFLVVLYPTAKRYTYWPQALLGMTFNYGTLLGWCAVRGTIDLPILPLYAAGFCWTLVYDTIYAHQDKYYDLLIGVKSTALKFGDQTKPILTLFASGMVGCLALTGYLCDQTWPYYTGVLATAAHLAHQLYTADLDDPDDCLKKFKSNTQLGCVLFLGIILGTLLKSENEEESKQSKQISK